MKKSENMNTFAKLVSDIVGEAINPEEHIHIGSGRAYYIQPTLDGAPMLLRHYRGSLFIDMSEADYNAINSGSIDAEKYVNSSNWLLGYYWGGGSMVGGGYYQPIDLVNRSEDVKRYIRILSCRTSRVSSGYRPTEDQCTNCSVKNCPFSTAECNKGILENETIQEKDPRHDIFKLVLEKFENQFPGYTLRGMLSAFKDGDMKENECLVRANKRYQENDPYSFIIWFSSETIRGIMMRTISAEDIQKIVDNITFYHSTWDFKVEKDEDLKAVTMESIAEIFSRPGMDYPAEKAKAKAEEEARIAAKKVEAARIATKRARWGIF